MAFLSSTAVPFSSTLVHAQLKRILADARFAKSPQLSRFLKYCVERTLLGDVDRLKEQVLGIEVFRRSPDFDPRVDPIVRVEARRLRHKLEEFYDTAGRLDPVLIMFPRGEYVPRFSTGWTGGERHDTKASPARILVVEDERLVARDIETRLKNFGYEVVGSTGTGEGALNAAEKLRPDLVLMDIVLSGAMKGTEAAQTIWRRWKSPIVYLTAFSDAMVMEEMKGTEAYGYVLKPYDPRQLKGAIEVALSRREKERRPPEVAKASQADALCETLAHAGITAFEWVAPTGPSAWPEHVALAAQPKLPSVQITPDEFLNRILPADRDRVTQAFRRAIDSRSRVEATYRLWLDTSTVSTALVTGLIEEDGDLIRITGVEVGSAAPAESPQSSDLHHFLLAAGHDLQEPLRSIGVYTELLARRFGNSDQASAPVIEEIRRGVDRMRVLLTDLVSYSQVVKQEVRHSKRFPLDAALDAALLNLRAAIEESGALLERDPLPAVWGHESQFVQVFQNLVSNSIKYRRAGEPLLIQVRADEAASEFRISVRDNGTGFQPEYADEIFSAFKRLHGKSIEGTGIGLTICRRVIEMHGGRIWAETEPGKGTAFHFCLPRLSS
jgi:signal transduction histidine kinase